MGVKGSTRQGREVDEAPTDLKNGPTNDGAASTPLPIKLLSLASPGLKQKREGGVKSGRFGALKPGRRGLRCKATKCSYAGTEDLGVLTTH